MSTVPPMPAGLVAVICVPVALTSKICCRIGAEVQHRRSREARARNGHRRATRQWTRCRADTGHHRHGVGRVLDGVDVGGALVVCGTEIGVGRRGREHAVGHHDRGGEIVTGIVTGIAAVTA